MLRVVLLSPLDDWCAALSAMLRERGVEVSSVREPIDALASLGSGQNRVLIAHAEGIEEETHLVAMTARRRLADAVRLVLVHPTPTHLAPWDHVERNPWALGAIAAQVPSVGPTPAQIETTASPPAAQVPTAGSNHAQIPPASLPQAHDGGDAGHAHVRGIASHDHAHTRHWTELDAPDETDLLRMLRIARHEDYFTLLGLRRSATSEEARQRATEWSARLEPARIPPRLGDRFFGELREIRAAVRDAGDVLGHAPSRDVYLRGLLRPRSS